MMIDIRLDGCYHLNVNTGWTLVRRSQDQDCMRKSKQEAAQTRQRIIEAAAVELRRNGIGGTGLAGQMAAAGLTHGGFYRHFDSKDQLIAEACAAVFDSGANTKSL
jgi:AcrR family transcriptional regulator